MQEERNELLGNDSASHFLDRCPIRFARLIGTARSASIADIVAEAFAKDLASAHHFDQRP